MWFARLRECVLVGTIWIALLAIVGLLIHLTLSVYRWIGWELSLGVLLLVGMLAAWGVFQLILSGTISKLARKFQPKYFGKIKEAENREAADPWTRPPPFRLAPASPPGLIGEITSAVAKVVIGLVLRLYRIFAPNGRLLPLSYRLVTRFKDVTEVLNDPDRFRVPFGPEWTAMGDGRNSVLGMDGPTHARQRALFEEIMGRRHWHLDKIRISTKAAEVARGLIEEADGGLDVIADVFQRTITEVCVDYLGLEAPDRAAYADWLISKTWLTFGDPTGVPEVRARAMQGARLARSVIEHSLEVATHRPSGDTLANRLRELEAKGRLDRDESIAILDGAAGGLVPTTTLCMTRLFCELMRHPHWWNEAQALAWTLSGRTGTQEDSLLKDRTRLQDILLEAARLAPTLYPGQFRWVETAGVIAKGTLRAAAVKPGEVLMVATAAALRDGRRFRYPNLFNPDRSPEEKQAAQVMFGDGVHKCIGLYASIEMMVEIAIALLSQEDLSTAPGDAGKLVSVGPFPRQLNMTWKTRRPIAGQQMVVIAARLPPTNAAALSQALVTLQAARGRDDMERSGIVHFASFSVVDLHGDPQGFVWPGKQKDQDFWLVGDLNFDGPFEAGLDRIASRMVDWLPTFRLADPSINTRCDLARFLKAHALDIKATPWGATGLQYQGSIGLPVSDIQTQAQLAGFVREVADFLNTHGSLEPRDGSRPAEMTPDAVQILDTVRRLIRQDPDMVMLAAGNPAITSLVLKGAEFRPLLLRPVSKRLAFADYVTSPDSENPPPGRVAALIAADRQRAITLGVLLALAVGVVAALRIFPGGGPLPGALEITGILGESLIWVLIAALVTAGLAAGLFTLLLLAHEAGDRSDPSNASPAQVTEVETFENEPGYAQNHMISVTRLKAGVFRRYTLALGMWVIRLLALFAFRQGNLARMGTIHFARWVKPPGAQSVVFLSNYDGSWLSYLEDFTALASSGLNLAWGHSQGAPTPRLLVLDGASDPDAFKRFAKRSLQKTNFWFSGYPGLTLENIRRNALIHDGLMRAANASEARDWLDMLASVKRPDREIETPEVQTLILRGLGSLPAMACGLVRFDAAADLVSWTDALTRTVNFGNEDPDPHRWEQRLWSQVLAGDRHPLPEEPTATFVAFTATGLTKLGLPAPDSGTGLGAFLAPFNQGMGGRSRVLRDGGPSSPASWQWSDASPWTGRPEGDRSVDAVLLVYGVNPGTCQAVIDGHVNTHGLTLVKRITSPVRPVLENGLRAEPFGFADGISNPAIKGLRGNPGLQADQVSPGEVLLGYPHMRGGLPPTCEIRGHLDPLDILPAIRSQAYRRYPAFGLETGAAADHDFGRNGTFLVVRQLEQDVAGFIDYTRQAAAALVRQAGAPNVDADWVAAKMVGRWRDGSPVVLYPDRQPRRPDMTNDFLYATLDPRGFACPLGSHVRRTNPRDSLMADDLKTPNHISSHRILRRGRAYLETDETGKQTEGLIFLAACSDLERQFEFVQQSWIGDPSFHGLTGESDPVVDSDGKLQDLSLPDGRTVRRLKGIPDFVTVRGGGYFFMPSRSALYYLADRARRRA